MILLEDGCAAHSDAEHDNSVQSVSRFCTVDKIDTVVFAHP